MQTLPQTSRYLKKKKKNANYLCLINIHDIRPHRYAPQSNPFLSLSLFSSSVQAPSTFPHLRSFNRPTRSSPTFSTLVDTAIRSVDEEGLRKFLNTESCWRCWHPPSSIYDAAKLNFLSCRLLGVWILVVGEWKRYVPGIFRGFWRKDFFAILAR